MEILPVIKLMEQDLESIDNESQEEVVNESEEEEEEEVEKIIPKVEPKQIIPEENIFEDKKPIKKKRQLTEAQKEHLKKGREKALAVRRAKAEERKKMKELENKEIELVKKAKQKRVQKLEEEVSDKPIEQKNINKALNNFDINPELIKKIQQDAIEGYDKIRKERKAIKKKQQEEQQRNMVHANTINNALNPVRPAKYGESGFFDHLF